MKLTEILKVQPLQKSEAAVKLSPQEIKDAHKIGIMAHGFTVFRVRHEIAGLIIFFISDRSDNIIGQMAVQHAKMCNISGYIVRRSFIVPGESNKGYGSDFYVFVRQHLKATIFSDEMQSPEGIALWKSLGKRFSVKVLNTQTGDIHSTQEADTIYTNNPDDSADYLLMLEAPKKSNFPEQCSEAQNFLTPYALFAAGDY